MTYTLNIAKAFSDTPSGRYKSQGDFSAEAFRDDYLVPAINKYHQVSVVLDGVYGFGSSFLEETFGGLIREHNFLKSDLDTQLKIISDEDTSYITEINEYIESAQNLKGS